MYHLNGYATVHMISGDLWRLVTKLAEKSLKFCKNVEFSRNSPKKLEKKSSKSLNLQFPSLTELN